MGETVIVTPFVFDFEPPGSDTKKEITVYNTSVILPKEIKLGQKKILFLLALILIEFNHLFNQHLLSTYCVPGNILAGGIQK